MYDIGVIVLDAKVTYQGSLTVRTTPVDVDVLSIQAQTFGHTYGGKLVVKLIEKLNFSFSSTVTGRVINVNREVEHIPSSQKRQPSKLKPLLSETIPPYPTHVNFYYFPNQFLFYFEYLSSRPFEVRVKINVYRLYLTLQHFAVVAHQLSAV